LSTNNTLWVFGDSFAANDSFKTLNGVVRHDRWWEQLAKKLNLNIKNCARSGTSIDYTSLMFHKNFKKLKRNDVIVLALTDTQRQWLNKDMPTCTTFQMYERLKNLDKISDEIFNHALYHFTEVLNSEVERTSAVNFINSVSYLTLKKGVKFIILPCFNHGHDAMVERENTILGNNVIYPKKGHCLWTISVSEFKGKEKKLPKKVIDHRFNHLSPDNHTILANKLYDSLRTGTLDLSPKDFLIDIFTASEVRKLNNTWESKYNI